MWGSLARGVQSSNRQTPLQSSARIWKYKELVQDHWYTLCGSSQNAQSTCIRGLKLQLMKVPWRVLITFWGLITPFSLLNHTIIVQNIFKPMYGRACLLFQAEACSSSISFFWDRKDILLLLQHPQTSDWKIGWKSSWDDLQEVLWRLSQLAMTVI